MIDLKKTQINGKNSTFMDWKKLILLKYPYYPKASLIAQLVNHVPVMQEIQVQFLSQEDTLEKEMATHSSILPWRIPWTEEPARLQSMGLHELNMT